MAYFLVASSGHAALLAARMTFVGSDPQVEIPIRADLGLAPRHFVIVEQSMGHCVQSLAQGVPVTVNGMPVQFQELRVGDWIQAGQVALCYQSDTPVSTEPAPPPTPLDDPNVPALASPSRDGEVRTGYRRPESPRPLDLDQEGAATPIAALPNLGKAMVVTDRARAYVAEQKASQCMSGAVVAGVIAAIAISFVWAISTILPTIFFMAVVSGLGYAIGCAVRMGGKGFDLKFGYTGALCALLAGLLANYAKVSALDSASERVPASGKVEIYGADESTNESFRESLTDLGVDPDSEEFQEAMANDESVAPGGSSWVLLLLFLFGPRALISYGIAMGAAYKASFRTLTAGEAARMQYG